MDDFSNGVSSGLLQPRARRPVKSQLIRKIQDEGLKPDEHLQSASGISSGTVTPIPTDAPPSVKATSTARRQIRAQQKRLFPTIQYAARVSHFDPNSDYRDFRGFFVLFWISLTIMVITAMLRSYRETGLPLVLSQWSVLTENIYELALSDLLMAASTSLSLPLHRLYMNSSLFRWKRGGMLVQILFQAAWLSHWLAWPFVRTWTWTAQVFFTLHLLSLAMKMHSYAFYNGHLSETYRRLNDLDKPETASKAAATRYPSPHTRIQELEDDGSDGASSKQSNEDVSQLRDDLACELTSPLGRVTYPQNLTFANYLDFLFCPTLCYELEYPRTAHRRYIELFWKSLAVFGCIFLLTITSEEFIIPVLDESAVAMLASHALVDRALILAETISRLLFPFMVTFLLVFLVIFEYLLGAFAEITCFADRHFYADWWNSCDWLEFSREWNIPVHHWFRRHVYSASRGHLSRPVATVITFLISALLHELVMGCITKKLRGYGFFMMMMQMPIVTVQRSKWMRGKKLLNNVLFWWSMILGLSMMCALYVLV
ncbi:sterol O-acyltransferase [Trichodelitschia bisporula]|uniref:O-acyltransferase n=1 Tax=Trichodelitschia bisporula TaxID=703511 RepID=A0A6G1HX22_9PEZI|nr:sterol O-acyltransferase [Trichodelitschia bisporula]